MNAYDTKTTQTFKGEVTAVETGGPRFLATLIILRLKTDRGELQVDVGPIWYYKRLEADLEEGDQIEIYGSLVSAGAEKWVVAASITKDQQVWEFRDKKTGRPFWAGPSHPENKSP